MSFQRGTRLGSTTRSCTPGPGPYAALHRVRQPGDRLVKDECLEDANGVRHHISPSDPRNLLKADYSRWRTSKNPASASIRDSIGTGFAKCASNPARAAASMSEVWP